MYVRFEAGRWKEEDLAKRICQLLYGDDEVREDATGCPRRWCIGTANDAWLHPEREGVYLLHYRYGTAELERALALVLEWRLGVRLLPDR